MQCDDVAIIDNFYYFVLVNLTIASLLNEKPALLAYSLEKRLKPRIVCLNENYISFSYAPPYLMSLSDSKFEQWYAF